MDCQKVRTAPSEIADRTGATLRSFPRLRPVAYYPRQTESWRGRGAFRPQDEPPIPPGRRGVHTIARRPSRSNEQLAHFARTLYLQIPRAPECLSLRE